MARKSRPYFHPTKRRWRVRIDGVEHFAPPELGPDQEPQAWAWLARLQGQAPGPVVEPARVLVADVRALYLQWLDREQQARRVSVSTFKNSRTHLNRFAGFRGFGRIPAGALTADHLATFLESIRALSPNTRRNHVKTIQAALNWAAAPLVGRARLIPENPLRGIRRPSVPRRDRYVAGSDVRRFGRQLWAVARRARRRDHGRDNRLACWLLRFLRLTGARPGEACKLLWSDVDWSNGWIELPPDRHKTGRKTENARIIALTDRVARLLRRVEHQGVRLDRHVFGHSKGPWNAVAFAARIRSWRKETAGSIRPYGCRHSYISEALARGLPIHDLAHLVGNSPSIIERHYDHAIRASLAERAREFERRRSG